jgi:hypothetical protein
MLSATSVILVAGCAHQQTCAPRSEAGFVEAYRAAYESGDRRAILRLVKWDGVPRHDRRLMTWALAEGAGHRTVTSIRIVPFEADESWSGDLGGRELESNLEPRYWLLVETRGAGPAGEGTVESKLKTPVGVEEGTLLFCGGRRARP